MLVYTLSVVILFDIEVAASKTKTIMMVDKGTIQNTRLNVKYSMLQ